MRSRSVEKAKEWKKNPASGSLDQPKNIEVREEGAQRAAAQVAIQLRLGSGGENDSRQSKKEGKDDSGNNGMMRSSGRRENRSEENFRERERENHRKKRAKNSHETEKEGKIRQEGTGASTGNYLQQSGRKSARRQIPKLRGTRYPGRDKKLLAL